MARLFSLTFTVCESSFATFHKLAFLSGNVVPKLTFTLLLMCSADVKACGIEGRSCYQKMGVLRVSLGCFVSFSVKCRIIYPCFATLNIFFSSTPELYMLQLT